MPRALFQVAVVQGCRFQHGSRSGKSGFGLSVSLSYLPLVLHGACACIMPRSGMVGSELAWVHFNFTVVSVGRPALACAVVVAASP